MVQKMLELFRFMIIFSLVACMETSALRVYRQEKGKRAVADITKVVQITQLIPGVAVRYQCLSYCDRNLACRAVNIDKNNRCELIYSQSFSVVEDVGFNFFVLRCPEGFDHMFQSGTPHQDGRTSPSCYKVEDRALTMQEARAFCNSMGSNLVSIETLEEQTHIVSNLNLSGISAHVWTSGYDRYLDGGWRWTSSDANMVYKNWSPPEPNNGSGNEKCCALAKRLGFRWADVSCDIDRELICEKPVSVCN